MSQLVPRCPICYDLIREPVVFPCRHEVCLQCFEKSMETANLWCPLCRKRVSSWARKNVRNPVNDRRKREIQEKLSTLEKENCLMVCSDDETITTLDLDHDVVPSYRGRILSDPGEIYEEYKSEIQKIKEERESEEYRGEVEAWRIYHEEQQRTKEEHGREEELSHMAAVALQNEEDDLKQSQQQQLDEDEKMAELLSQEFILQSLENQQKQTTKDQQLAERLNEFYRNNSLSSTNSKPLKRMQNSKTPRRKTSSKHSAKRSKSESTSPVDEAGCIRPITFWLKSHSHS